MKEFTVGLLYLILAFIASVAIIAIIYALYGAILYFGLLLQGIQITFIQAFVLALLISVVGMLFRGGNSGSTRKQTKGDE
ncbi:hypothetical protein [Cytobacillus massiliigabonensis]|uniref:hypothetical protein n=1 Tax=Cytobacillus massiliigabonensis TaxID=1871011 RepID=UPI000C850DF3|nr:hypothetical protein [Cytobacillus massiliigabonensis]